MEFFERAHIPKSAKKDSKSEEKVKQQLKQMLYGYKNSDNEIIKNIANEASDYSDPTRCLEDSISVSGFSDLNLTDSSNEAENTQGTVESHVLSSSELNELDLGDDKEKVDSLESFESISEYNDDIHSLSEDLATITEGSECNDSDDISFITSLTGTSTTIDSDSGEFDPDGSLAKKILTKINEKDKSIPEKSKKRKIEKLIKSKPEVKLEKEDKKKKKTKSKDIKHITAEEDIVANISEESTGNQLSDDNSNVESKSTSTSEAFISISASQMPEQSLSDILGDYKHSTVKNLPSDKQNVIYSSSYSGAFENEDLSPQNVQIEEDVHSLTPDLDDDFTTEDVVLDDTDVNMSTEPLEQSTSNYDDSLQSDSSSTKESDSVPYSNPIKVYYGKKCCILVLKHPAELYIHGKVKLSALGGTVVVFGYTLKEEPCELYAPNCSYAYCLRTVNNFNTYYGLFSKLTASGLSVLESECIVTSIGPNDGVVCMYPLKSPVMDYVEANFTAADLFKKPNKFIDNSLKTVSELLGCSLYRSKPNKCFEELPIWEKAIDYGLKEQSRGIVCGGKGTGKSTFLRYYVNRLLAQGPVVVIDCDPGQAEFTPAGNVSATVVTKPLLGPNFTHLRTPDVMLHMAMINTMENPRLYMDGIYNTFLHLDMDERYKNMPWVVNTMGLCNNMGFRIINAIILIFRPTFVLQIHSKNIKKRFEQKLHRDIVLKLYEEQFTCDYIFNSVSWPDGLDYKLILVNHEVSEARKSPLSPRDERYLNFLAYFGQLASLHNGDILSVVPYEVSLSDLNIGANVQVPRGTIAKVINGKIVALCEQDTQDKGFSFKLDYSMPLVCYGYGLVRGVDFERATVYIITGVPVEKLPQVNTVVYSDWAPELRAGDALPAGTQLPYRTASEYHQRKLMLPPRRRFNPIQLLKMSRSS